MISGKTPIAIIGIGCRFPGSSDDPSSFWQLLVDGKDVVREITPDRWSIDKHYSPKVGVPGKSYSKWAGLLDDIDRFEPEFFGISPREAHYMDPQQRILLEVAWSALEDAGLPAEQISGTKTGVYVGISTNDYAQLESSSDQHLVDAHSATGGAFSIAANRISYCFDLRGPSMVVDTACSSSLVSTHLACNSLWNGECDMALAGGVNIIIGPGPFIAFSSATMLSPDGRCKAFDASANGFVRGEGAGMVLLKPLDKALADGDTIYATIAATGVNQDARTQGITLPSRQAQQALLAQVYGEAGIAPSDVWYVEAHGTGTGVGDPIETNALGNVFSQDREDAFPLNIGSVKTNIGHLEAGAGIAGLIKACLALKHRTLPPSLHFNEPNPKIPFDGLKLKVVNELTRVDDHLGKPLVAGVNSFGFGGTNAHVVLQEFTQSEPQGARTAHTQASYLMPLSAYSEEGLEALVKAYLNFVTQEGQTASLADICSTAACRRSHFDQRLALVVSDKEELVERFQAFIDGERRPGMSTGRREGGDERRLAFVFSGQGPQWWRMARELLDTNAVFRAKIEQVDTLVRELGDWSLLEELGADEAHSRMHDTRYAQPALFALQVGLVEVLKQWGVVPDAVVGHSVGEVAAAHVCGALSLEQAVKVIYHRGRCMASAPGGRMLALGVPFEEAEPLAASHQGRVSVAANNSPVSVTLSGDGEALESVAAQFENSSTFCRFLPVKYAFHSAHMEPIREELMAALEGIEAVPAQLPVYSAVTGEAIDGTALGAEYWWRNVRQPVRFADAIGRLAEEEHTFFVELSPHPVLGTSISQCLGQNHRSNVVVPTLRRDTSDNVQMLGAVGMLYTAGYPVNWRRLWPLPGSFVQLPGYQWQRASYWHEPKPTREFRIGRLEHPLLAKRFQLTDPTWEVQLTTRLMPYLGDHRVQGRTVVPAAAYVEMALAAGYALSSGEAPVLEEMRFTKALFLPDAGDAHRVQFNNSVEDGSFRISSAQQASEQTDWALNCAGYLRSNPRPTETTSLDLDALRAGLEIEISKEACYRRFAEMGLDYGPEFQGIQVMHSGHGVALGRVGLAPDTETKGYRFQPALLDSCFQVISGTIPQLAEEERLYLPARIDRVSVYGQPKSEVWVYAELRYLDTKSLIADLRIASEDGQILMFVEGFTCDAITVRSRADSLRVQDWMYDTVWLPGQYMPEAAGIDHRQSFFNVHEKQQEGIRREISASAKPLADGTAKRSAALSRLAFTYVIEALRRIGLSFRTGNRFELNALIDELSIAQNHGRLFACLLDGVAALDNCLQRVGEGQWEVVSEPQIEPARQLYRTAFEQFPAGFAELTLVNRFGTQLDGLLRGEVNPLMLLFTADGANAAEHLYQDSPSFRYENTFVAQVVDRAVNVTSSGRRLRVLEIGAGTGGLSSYVLPMLPQERTEYVFTDISGQFFDKARQNFREYAFVEYQTLDIEKSPLGQGFAAHSFDLILASDVLHATCNLRSSLGNVRELLMPGGTFMFLETADRSLWVDMIFGFTEGWWRFQDHDLRPEHPLLGRDQWPRVLREAGFETASVDSINAPDEVSSHVIVQGRVAEDLTAGVDAEEAASCIPAAEPEGTWLIFADSHGLAASLETRIGAAGGRYVVVNPGEEYAEVDRDRFRVRPGQPNDMKRVVEAVVEQGMSLAGVIYLWGLDAAPNANLDLELLQASENLTCYSMMHLVQSLAALDLGHPLRVAIVTQGAQEVPGYQRALTVSQAPLVGLGRLIPNEHGNLRCQLLDLDAGSCSGQAEAIYKELCLEETENELALREGTWFVPRMDRMRSVSEYLDLTGVTDEALPAFRLHPGESGVIGGLELREVNRPQPGQGQVEIRVVTAALNFRDVLKSLNLYPSDGGDYTYLGDECAGIVTAVGEGVSNVAVGDEVVAVAPGSFGAYVLTRAEVLMPKPRNLDFEEAVTIPITFLTAYYALHELARIQPGETVLIQAAAGGVGLSAIQIAHAAGARVFATAGTPEKRELLRNLGVEHVMDSRSLAFADEVKEVTGGRGVDVVLNSLAGEAIPKGIASLAPYGRFLELGKRDLYQNSKLGLWSFRKNLSFHAIDLSRMLADRPQVIQRILGKIHGHISRGNFHPLPHRVFPVSRIKDAFRYMSQAKHIGKVVISMLDKRVSVRRAEPAAVSFEAAATYLVTGGTGGFGFAVARWLAANGARSVVLTSRSGKVDEDCARAIDELATQGVEMKVLRSDVTDQDDVKALVEQISTPNTPLKGVFHAAMVIDDGMLWQLDAERFRRVMAPKVDGCWNLHLSTLDQPLDHFVLFSSISSLVGNPGQANYVAANSFLDAFAQHRNSMGLPALAVNWGRIGDVGYVARNKNVEDNLERAGFLAIDPEKATEALGRLLAREVGNACVLRVDWRTHKKPAPRFSRLAVDSLPSEGQADERGQVRDSIKKAPESEQALLVFRYVMQQVSHVLGISSKRLDPNKPWNDLGIDSLMAVELQNKVENDLDITIPMVELMQTPTVDKLTHLVLSQLDIKAEGMFLDEPATQPEEENEVLVPLRTGGDQPAIICLHAADGQAKIYESFAQALPPGIPVYGVNAILTESGGDEGSLRNVVQQYAEIITQHLEPPYRLFGFSYGGLLAMMVAEELHRAGVVEFVGVVDFNPEMVGARHANVDLLGDIVHGLASFVSEKADFFVKRSYEERQEQARALASELMDADKGVRNAKVLAWIRQELELPESLPLELVEAFVEMFGRHLDVLEGTELPFVDAPVFSWTATEGLVADMDIIEQLSGTTSQAVVNHTLECGHWDILDHPHVGVIAGQLADRLSVSDATGKGGGEE